jgi:hypothetical protein
MPGRAGDASVEGHERGIQQFRDGDIRAVVDGEVVPELPGSSRHGGTRIEREGDELESP